VLQLAHAFEQAAERRSEPPSTFWLETMPTLKTIVANLDRAEQRLLRAADAVSANQWKARPAKDDGRQAKWWAT